MTVICVVGVLIVIVIFAYYPIRVFVAKSTVRKQPTGWYLYHHPNDYFSLNDQKENEVVQWLQGMPVEVYLMGCRYESPYTFDGWLEKGERIEGLEDTLLSLYISRYRSLLQPSLSLALKRYGTQKSLDFFRDRLEQNRWTDEAKNEMYDILYGVVKNESEFSELLEAIEREKPSRLNDPNYQLF